MTSIRELFDKNTQSVYRCTIKKSVKIIDTKDGYFVLKKKKENRNLNNELPSIYDYLQSRSFTYFPKLLRSEGDYDVFEYISDVDTPREQKAIDLMNLTALLHSKTTYFKEIDMDVYKEIYEDYSVKIDTLYNYYNGLMNVIDQSTYMSPREYLLAFNSSKIFAALNFCQKTLDSWYELVKDSRKQRVVLTHNNLDIDHLLENDKPYFISWEHAKRAMPMNDLYQFYRRHYLEFDFKDLFQLYEKNYPLTKEEKMLFFVMLSIPEKIEFTHHMYQDCKNINRILEYIYKTESLVIPNRAEH